ncbi:MAG: hypothetical protein EBV24_02865 [Actinobacteria bacterium]|nr:hypothetical protein [Actinomycetota bacterium]
MHPLSIGPLKHVCGFTRLTGRRPNLTVDCLIRDPKRGEQSHLTVGGSTRMASHGRDNEGESTAITQPRYDTSQRCDARSESAAARSDGNGFAGNVVRAESRNDRLTHRRFDVGHRVGQRNGESNLVEIGYANTVGNRQSHTPN